MLCFCACEEPTRKYQVTTDAAAPDAALWRTFSTTLSEADIAVVRAAISWTRRSKASVWQQADHFRSTPDNQTFSDPVGMSQARQRRTIH